MAHLLGRLAGAAAHHWKRSLALILAVLVVLGGLAALGGEYSDEFSTPGTESQAAYDLLAERFPAQSGDTANVVFAVEDGTLRDGARAAAVNRTAAEIAAQPNVTSAVSPLSEEGAGQLSGDGRIGFITVQYDEQAGELGRGRRRPARGGVGARRRARHRGLAQRRHRRPGRAGHRAHRRARRRRRGDHRPDRRLPLGGGDGPDARLGAHRARRGILLLTFGTRFTDFPSFAPTLGVMLGLGAGIDYALLIVGPLPRAARPGRLRPPGGLRGQRDGRDLRGGRGRDRRRGHRRLLATGIPFVGRMGVGSAIVIAAVAVGAITVLPALMGAWAKRLRPKDPSHVAPSAGFARWGTRVTSRPWLSAAAGTLVLLVLAAPFSGLRLGQPDDGNDRAGSTTRVAYDRLAEGFGAGFNGPLLVAVDTPAGERGGQAVQRLQQAIADTPGVAAAAPAQRNAAGDAATLAVIPASSPQDERTSELVERLRDQTIPQAITGTGARAYVGGAVATLEDLADKIASRLPLFIGLVVGLSVLLLMAVFRSVWVPLVSAAFNLLSILAAYGVVVAVFQNGWGAGLLGIDGEVPIVSFVPLFMFAVLFGLSMDYNVFLQSRIREEYLRGAGPRDSVVKALSRVAKIILAAGVIMTAVFLGFVSDPTWSSRRSGSGSPRRSSSTSWWSGWSSRPR
jgi:RND superfamily putative drug exporter